MSSKSRSLRCVSHTTLCMGILSRLLYRNVSLDVLESPRKSLAKMRMGLPLPSPMPLPEVQTWSSHRHSPPSLPSLLHFSRLVAHTPSCLQRNAKKIRMHTDVRQTHRTSISSQLLLMHRRPMPDPVQTESMVSERAGGYEASCTSQNV